MQKIVIDCFDWKCCGGPINVSRTRMALKFPDMHKQIKNSVNKYVTCIRIFV